MFKDTSETTWLFRQLELHFGGQRQSQNFPPATTLIPVILFIKETRILQVDVYKTGRIPMPPDS